MKDARSTKTNDRPISSRELVKVNRDTLLENVLFWSGLFCLVWAAILFWRGKFGHTNGGHYYPPDPTQLSYIPIFVAVSSLLLVTRFFTDNYYLLDPKCHQVFYHFRLLWFSRLRLLLDAGDILAVTCASRRRTNRSGVIWEYRVVVLDQKGRQIPITDWSEDLGECNEEAAGHARTLSCQYHPTPLKRRLRIVSTGKSVSIEFAPLRIWEYREFCIVMFIVIALGTMALLRLLRLL